MKKIIILLILELISARALFAGTNNMVVTDGGLVGATNIIGTYHFIRTVHSETSGFDYQLYCHVPDNGWGISKFYTAGVPQIYVSYSTNYYSTLSTQVWKDVYNDIRYGSGDSADPFTYFTWTGLNGFNTASGKIDVKTNE